MNDNAPFRVAVWSEEFSGFHKFKTEAEARAFADGWSAGAGEYGAGKCSAYVLPGDEDQLSDEEREEIEQAEADDDDEAGADE